MDRAALATSRRARALALIAIAGCSPGAFDDLIGRAGPDAGGGSGGRGGTETRDASTDAGGRDGAIPPPPIEAGAADTGAPSDDAGAGMIPLPDAGAPAIEDAGTDECPHATDPDAVDVSATELGTITIPSVMQPRSGPIVRVGARMLWTFLTEMTTVGIWTRVPESLDAPPELQAPSPFVPLLPLGAVPSNFAQTIGGAVVLSNSQTLIYYAAYGYFEMGESGLAQIEIDAPQAQILHSAGQLFPQPPAAGDAGAGTPWFPHFFTGVVTNTEPDGVYIYVYACNGDPDAPSEQPGGANEGPCRIARTRLEDAKDGTRYRYWNGRGWVGDSAAARIAINQVPGALSVSYNRYLEKFLAVHSAGVTNQVALRWADRPEGPWHDLDQFETIVGTAAYGFTIDAKEHPALRDACHQVLYVTYLLPRATTDENGARIAAFETRLVRVELQ